MGANKPEVQVGAPSLEDVQLRRGQLVTMIQEAQYRGDEEGWLDAAVRLTVLHFNYPEVDPSRSTGAIGDDGEVIRLQPEPDAL